MSMENFPKKEIVVISAAAVATGIGAATLRYIWKRKRENKVIFVEGIDQETADLIGVVATHSNNQYLAKIVDEIYDGEQPVGENEKEDKKNE